MSTISFTDAFGRSRRGIDVDNPVYGSTIAYSNGIKLVGTQEVNHVASAFYKRTYLVELQYAQKRFVVAVSDMEIEEHGVFVMSPASAQKLAHKRATAAYTSTGTPLGNLIGSRVLPDCFETRETLGVGGPKEEIEYGAVWKDAT